ncbi:MULTISPECIES: SDR family NAD(P)-dependent oxidoreductase [Olivibacter]|jgi:glucose 1-dehydrogenase|uniref:SDR family NAD(P)-dependent oxidoreductase n=1 Tax=Olivibacter jilunii TaxID=985016 RepID=A0ABW6AVY7_9SPHI|nr:SDR family oxidoreductase [Olivibacter sp. 47]MCL4641136.1 SDR family oxidoreductase [Olivibacter sp. UJ_SKK_5.1]MDM8175032.1 SDR family oxidoreductase [Olivibacter sp. 47]MDX3913282.1 SDR family oxidoreductase [Pseudosphingobacterium sp.]
MSKLKDKVALITGSDSGIGRAIAEAYASEGAQVIITYHSDRESAKEAEQKIKKLKTKVSTYQLDVSDETSVQSVFGKAVKEFGQIDILVSNAGVNGSNIPVVEMDTETFDTCIKTNLYGAFYCCREFLRLRKNKLKGTKIIIVSSIHEEVCTAGNADYNASKGGVRNFSKSLALELAPKGVCVNNIAPGMILTPMNQQAMDNKKVREEKEQHIPIKRAGKPEEIGPLAVYLASSDSDYVTGTTFTIDGALSINLGQGA